METARTAETIDLTGATTMTARPAEITTTDEAATMIAVAVVTMTGEVGATAEGATTTTGAPPSRPRVTTTTTEHPEGPGMTRLLADAPRSLLLESRQTYLRPCRCIQLVVVCRGNDGETQETEVTQRHRERRVKRRFIKSTSSLAAKRKTGRVAEAHPKISDLPPLDKIGSARNYCVLNKRDRLYWRIKLSQPCSNATECASALHCYTIAASQWLKRQKVWR